MLKRCTHMYLLPQAHICGHGRRKRREESFLTPLCSIACRFYSSVAFKLRGLLPCIITNLSIDVQIPKSDDRIVQVLFSCMASLDLDEHPSMWTPCPFFFFLVLVSSFCFLISPLTVITRMFQGSPRSLKKTSFRWMAWKILMVFLNFYFNTNTYTNMLLLSHTFSLSLFLSHLSDFFSFPPVAHSSTRILLPERTNITDSYANIYLMPYPLAMRLLSNTGIHTCHARTCPSPCLHVHFALTAIESTISSSHAALPPFTGDRTIQRVEMTPCSFVPDFDIVQYLGRASISAPVIHSFLTKSRTRECTSNKRNKQFVGLWWNCNVPS